MTVSGILFIIFCVAAVITGVISATLYYHWVRYGVNIVGTLSVMITYGLGTVVILLMLLGLVIQS